LGSWGNHNKNVGTKRRVTSTSVKGETYPSLELSENRGKEGGDHLQRAQKRKKELVSSSMEEKLRWSRQTKANGEREGKASDGGKRGGGKKIIFLTTTY